MRDNRPNRYECAFENWLRDHRIPYVRSDEHRRLGASYRSVKNFDFLLLPAPDRKVIVEVKGRTFAGTTLVDLTGFDCWVTTDDLESLQVWRQALGAGYEAAFVFVYRVAQADVDFDGHEVLTFGADRYLFFGVRLEDYLQHCRRRSPKWRTAALDAAGFRRCAVSPCAFVLEGGNG